MRAPLIVFAIAALNLFPELIFQFYALSGDAGQSLFLRQRVYQEFAFWPGLLGNWRANYPIQPVSMFFTYGFLHAGLWHLAINVVTLISLGRVLGARLGGLGFVLLYLAGLLGGAAGYAVLSRAPLPMVGASGALFGLAGAILVDRLIEDMHAFRLRDMLFDILWPLVWIVLLNIVMYRAFDGHLAWQAHLGGFVVGALGMGILRRFPAI